MCCYRKWNIDNICKVAEERSEFNNNQASSLKAEDYQPTGKTESIAPAAAVAAPAAASSSAKPAAKAPTTAAKPGTSTVSVATASPSKERISAMSYNDFAIEYEHILETYSVIRDLESTREYLYKNCNVLLHEHATSYLLLSALEDEMNMKFERMKLVSRQSQILSHITELGGWG